ncbi:MAG: hypothetical protein GY851_29060 [bacterium]|nr:hypothetical protein [bacterium]
MMELYQGTLAVVGCGVIATQIRWHVGFVLLDSVRVGWRSDLTLALGTMLVAQYFLI